MKDLIQMLMSFFVEAGGQGIGRGGKGALMAGFRKIGWAKGGGGGGGKSRLGGHSLGGHRMGSGVGRGGYNSRTGKYNAKEALKAQMAADANRGRRSGSDQVKKKAGSAPAHLHGRSSFSGTASISGNPNNRWVRNQRGGGSYTPKPRSFIKF